jgi:hypothetical protein
MCLLSLAGGILNIDLQKSGTIKQDHVGMEEEFKERIRT